MTFTKNMDIKGLTALIIIITLMILTRSHNPFTGVHLPDFTIPALFIVGIYFRQWIYPVVICVVAVAIDNYAIVNQGVSANCITTAYTLLPLAYLAVFWAAKFIPTLAVKSTKNVLNIIIMVFVITFVEWLFTSASYYAFTEKAWIDFPAYGLKWAPMALKYVFYWMAVVVTVFSINHHLSLITFYNKKHN